MNSFFLAIILVPIIEIYLLIKIGSEIGPLITIILIFTTAIVGIYYAKYEGLKTLKSGFAQLSKNEPMGYEILSGAGIALAAVLLIIPGFLLDAIQNNWWSICVLLIDRAIACSLAPEPTISILYSIKN